MTGFLNRDASGLFSATPFRFRLPVGSAMMHSYESVVNNGISRTSFPQHYGCVTSEITTAPRPVPEKIVEGNGSEIDMRLSKMGYRHYGIFASDPGPPELFGEIERQWDQQTIDG